MMKGNVMEEYGFEYDGVWISNPTVSPCGRFEVDPRSYYGANLCNMSDEWLNAWIAEVENNVYS